MVRIGGPGAVFRLDRREGPVPGGRGPYHPLYPQAALQQLECDQHSKGRGVDQAGTDAPAGLAAFARREEARSAVYSYEQRHEARLSEEQEAEFQANPAAWSYFESQRPSYRKAAIWWVTSAKREETKAKRLATLISDSAEGRTVASLSRPQKQ